MRWPEAPLVQGIFLERLHRFGAHVRVRGKKEYCHVPNSGRLKELLYPGARVALVDHLPKPRTSNSHSFTNRDGVPDPMAETVSPSLLSSGDARYQIMKTGAKLRTPRKTRFSIRLARFRGNWVCIEANIAPRLLKESWEEGRIPQLSSYDSLRPEVSLNAHTRFDFLAENSRTGTKAWIEVKCVTLVEKDGTARFPDAPSERASKHLRELTSLVHRPKTRCLVFFILQNPKGKTVGPKEDTDPDFGKNLRKAYQGGVRLVAFRARVNLRGSRLEKEIPVKVMST